MLVDKSLVVADDSSGRTRYRLLETVRQYAMEKLSESGEADAVRSRHRDHYTSIAALLDEPAGADYRQRLDRAELETDNLRSALGWNLENDDTERALMLASSLRPVWLTRGRMLEGLAWFHVILSDYDQDIDVTPAVQARALCDEVVLNVYISERMNRAQRAMEIAHELDDPALLARTLSAYAYIAGARYDAETSATYFARAIELARTLDDRWMLSQILGWQANTGLVIGDPVGALAAAEESREIADAIGDLSNSRLCRQAITWAHLLQGNVVEAISEFSALAAECEEAHDDILRPVSLMGLGIAHAHRGDVEAARSTATVGLEVAAGLGEYFVGTAYAQSSTASLAAGDIAAAHDAAEAAYERLHVAQPEVAVAQRAFNSIEVALARGDLTTARDHADAAVAIGKGYHLATALLVRARVAAAEGAAENGERDAHAALSCAAGAGLHLYLPGIFECLACLAATDGHHPYAVRLFGAADALRQRMGLMRFRIYDAECEAALAGDPKFPGRQEL